MGKLFAPPPLIYLSSPPPPTSFPPPSLNLDSKISPTVLLIIIILAIIFFFSGLLHLLVRCLLRPTQRDPDELDNVTALQGQLQQLFHLHDAGVDQSYIDTLPVFHYKAIIGVKDPFDCAVCLCEFEPDDKLRLLPKCSHAFHMDCIDTWLLSHSTCPLCRCSLLCDFSTSGRGYRNPIPIVCVLESGSGESSREIRESVSESDSRAGIGTGMGIPRGEAEFGSSRSEVGRKSCEIWKKEEGDEEKIVTIKLGKFKNVDGGEGSSEENKIANNNNDNSNSNNLGSRRCYSMGSFAYILDETTSLQVPVKTLMKKENSKNAIHRAAMSEYGCDSRREFNGIEAFRSIEVHSNGNGNENGKSKRESLSVSKIWQRGGGTGEKEKNRKGNDCSSRTTISEINIEEGELEGGDEVELETQSIYSVDSLANPTNSTSHRRTLLWLMGRHNKVAHNHSSSISSNV